MSVGWSTTVPRSAEAPSLFFRSRRFISRARLAEADELSTLASDDLGRSESAALPVADLLEVEVTDDPPQHLGVDFTLAPKLDERGALRVEELADDAPVGVRPAVDRLATRCVDARFVPIAPQARRECESPRCSRTACRSAPAPPRSSRRCVVGLAAPRCISAPARRELQINPFRISESLDHPRLKAVGRGLHGAGPAL